MAKGKREASTRVEDGEQQAARDRSTRLQNEAISQGILGKSSANPAQSMQASKALLKCDGKDIVKKGNRKPKFLFSFPGLVAPVAGGKFGDLVNLDTRNPILYVEFPEGRLKMFGTIVYPKNRYLTLQLSKGSKSVLCEDLFEAIVVFSETWWVGKLEDNPQELRLEMPSSLSQEKHKNYDFVAGAGGELKTELKPELKAESKPAQTPGLKQTTLLGFQSPSLPEESQPIRHSARNSAQKRSYVEIESDEEELEEIVTKRDPEESGASLKKTVKRSKSTILDFMAPKPAPQKKQATLDSLVKK